ncbi:TPA: hypothetical protein ACNBKL_004898 [Escherichia coli]|uniref:Uncharacterized protein n=3 Tax=root TaxID=1 RepID=A0A7G9UUA9_9CAUD|nr:hypothetical protein [Salmonella enterica subsp. enterica serovar Virchow]EAC0255664.1 hypothetical protein [Salmonella enterica subsp. enterica serovar Chester]EBU8165130.1 hypothetical protein [Salmonella enterica subsp. enterica serovar Stanleyville]EBX2234581.1 hypothetical protein [Salmonella enterica subsp. enterica serovar Weltevreden]EBY3091930.1 hypothetical protein [Salmonella enterica subsp. enterica serovar Typhimurium]MIP71605.1 hypothetical protein [Salmonella enterica subsp. 
MQFPISVIEDMARVVRNRAYVLSYEGVRAYSEALIAQHVTGTGVINPDLYNALVDNNVEAYLPLPHLRNKLCLSSQTLQFDNLPPLKYSPDDRWGSMLGVAFQNCHAPYNWSILVEGVDGVWYAIAHSDEFFFEPGELIKPVSAPQGRVKVGHCYIELTHVQWTIEDWRAASVIFGDGKPHSVTFERCEAEHVEEPDNDEVGDRYAPLEECRTIANIDWVKVFTANPGFRGQTINPGEVTWEGFVQLADKLGYDVWDYTYKRPYPNASEDEGHDEIILENLVDVENVFIDDEIFVTLGIERPKSTAYPVSVASVIQELGKMQEQTVEVKIDEEQMQIVAQVQKTLNLDKLYAEIRKLPKKKRTAATIKAMVRDIVGK